MGIRAIYGVEWCAKIEKVFGGRAKDGPHHIRSFMGHELETCSEGGSCNAISLKSSKSDCENKLGPCASTTCSTFYSNQSNPCLLNTGDYIYETSECVCTETSKTFPAYFSNGTSKVGCPTCEEGQIGCFARNEDTCQVTKVSC